MGYQIMIEMIMNEIEWWNISNYFFILPINSQDDPPCNNSHTKLITPNSCSDRFFDFYLQLEY
jgi:hypothetical protein